MSSPIRSVVQGLRPGEQFTWEQLRELEDLAVALAPGGNKNAFVISRKSEEFAAKIAETLLASKEPTQVDVAILHAIGRAAEILRDQVIYQASIDGCPDE